MEKAEKIETKTIQGDSFDEVVKGHKEEIQEIDEMVQKKAKQLSNEGYQFELYIPNESEIILRVGGKQFTFPKKKDTHERVVARIKEFGK